MAAPHNNAMRPFKRPQKIPVASGVNTNKLSDCLTALRVPDTSRWRLPGFSTNPIWELQIFRVARRAHS